MAKRKFTAEDKLKIIKEASEQGVTKTLAKYDVYPATYYSWRRKLKEQGEDAFSKGVTAKQLKELRHLEKENRQLKELVAEKELLIRALKEARSKKS
ncbi:transposase [Neolewinella agarilytica]|uniref:Putative transposase n=1 Tax=Neolewinella agarilytica TaxID=478744 RepID=A0A1H9PDV0_9BACT|nr:transposase [Neolewinella agarilytica]SER46370.1 putative transposase [Neolewinella agarilytica]